MRSLHLSFLSVAFLCVSLFAQQNAVPFVNQPLVPASVAPGGTGFTLTVNGTGFVSGSTVHWNGSPRATTFVSGSQLTAAILSSDIANATTASITVSSPGVTTSNIVFLPVREPSTFVSLNATSFGGEQDPDGVVSGDFNKDGNQDLALVSYQSNGEAIISILLGNGDGTFRQGAEYSGFNADAYVLTADINGDGNLDLLLANASQPNGNRSLGVMLGNGDGTFQQPTFFAGATCCYQVLGDFNREGAVDVAAPVNNEVCVFPGSGSGSFGQVICSNGIANSTMLYLTAGDFNSDGKLDLAVTGNLNGMGFIAVMLGNGDGTFQTPQMSATFTTSDELNQISTADFNGDGFMDLAAVDSSGNGVLIFLGNGDGTFRPPVRYATAFDPFLVVPADMNGDGKLDLVVTDYGYNLASVSVLLGNGDGTFQPYEAFGGSQESYSAVGDFNNDGKLDISVPNESFNTTTILTQDNGSAIVPSPQQLVFSTQLVDSVSPPKLITLTNTGGTPVNVSQIAISPNFSQLSNCRIVQPSGTCKIGVYFTPTIQGNLGGNLSITDNGGGSPQILNLSGVGTIVGVKPTSLNFGDEAVGHISKSQNVIVTNEGNGQMAITEIGIGGADPKDFSEVNACPQKLAAGASCEITVIFHPTQQGARDAILGIMDNGGGSPQQVPLSGNGT